MRWVAICICLFGVACAERISLGSECPTQSGRCSIANDGDDADDEQPGPDADIGPPETDGKRDAGKLDASTSKDGGPKLPEAGSARDSGSKPDAGVEASVPEDAGPPMFPAFRNPSFELNDSGTTGELEVLPLQSTALAPWYPCRNGIEVVTSFTTATNGPVHPTEGATFFADSFPAVALNINGLAQDLGEPLHAGQRYAFEVDLWSEKTNGTNLPELQVAAADLLGCLAIGLPLATSKPIEPGAWRPTCLSFTAPREVSTIMLWVGAAPNFNNWDARLFVDNLRPTVDCK